MSAAREPRPWVAVVLLPAGLLVLLVAMAALGLLFVLGHGGSTSSAPVAIGPTSGRSGTTLPPPAADPTPFPGSRTEAGLPPGYVLASGNPDTVPYAVVRDGRLYVGTWGSSVCPEVAVAVRVENRHRVAVDVLPAGGPTCTADLALRTLSVPLDASAVDLTSPLTVRLSGPGLDPSAHDRTQAELVATPVR